MGINDIDLSSIRLFYRAFSSRAEYERSKGKTRMLLRRAFLEGNSHSIPLTTRLRTFRWRLRRRLVDDDFGDWGFSLESSVGITWKGV